MCADFTNVNIVIPKDYFPLPNIDQLVDVTTSFEIMSFMDEYFVHHQIRMHTKDEEKIAFITEEGMFCYIRIPFGLINTNATYLKYVNKMFKHHIG